jgi:AFG3 family protein
MSERIGNLSFPQEDGAEFTKPYSEATAQTMDEEAREIVRRAYDRTLKLLEEKRALVESLAKLLLKKETLNHEDIVSVLGPRPYGTTAYDEFVRHSKLAKEEQQPTSTAEGKADAPVGGEAKEKPAAGDEIPAVAAVTPVEHAQSPPATAAAAATAAATTASRKSDGDSAA